MSVVVGPRLADKFVDRVDVQADMRTYLTERHARSQPCLLFVHGPEGIGRASLVGEFFETHRAMFDTYVEVSARQPNGSLVSAGEMCGQALRGLDMADAAMPTSDVGRFDAFQRLSAGKQFLMMIKDVVSAEQVRGLIPASAPEAVVVVTARELLRDVLIDGFVDVPLRELPRAESRELLEHSMRGWATQIDAEVVTELAGLCGGHPLLIRVLGAQLIGRPYLADQYLDDMRSSRSALLTMGEEQRFSRFLDKAYADLEKDLKQAYRRLSLLPGPSFSIQAAAAALETDVARAGRQLGDLVDKNLIQRDRDTGRYEFSPIMRDDARQRVSADDGADAVRSMTERVTRWYLREAIPRDAALADRWRVGPEFDAYDASSPEAPSRTAATVWFDAEWESVVGCVRAAHDQGLHDIAWQVCVAVFKYLHLHGHVDPWLDSHRLGVASAEMCGDRTGLMQVTSQRGAGYLAIGDTDRARADFEASLRAAGQVRHWLGEQSAWEWLGKTAARVGDTDEAFRCYDESEAVIRRAGSSIPAGQQARMLALLSLQRARAWMSRGDGEQAHAAAAAALEHFGSIGERDNQAKCLMVIGDSAFGSQELDVAARSYQQAAALFASDGARRLQADAARKLGDVRDAAGDQAGAAEAFRVAQELYVALGDKLADVVSARLSDLSRH